MSKGKVNERVVAKIIQAWWLQFEPGVEFTRTPQSGGWHSPKVRAGFRASGDLMTTSTRFPFCIEVKRREAWSLEWLVKGRASPVWDWWKQTQKAAKEVDCEPMMWFRHNRREWLVMVRHAFLMTKGIGASMRGPWLSWYGDKFAKHDAGELPVVFAARLFLVTDPAEWLVAANGQTPDGALWQDASRRAETIECSAGEFEAEYRGRSRGVGRSKRSADVGEEPAPKRRSSRPGR